MKRTILAMQSMLSHEMNKLEAEFEVIKLWEARDPEHVIEGRASDIVGILSTFNGPKVSARLIEALPNLEIIGQFGAGFDNVDIEAAHRRGVVVTNTPDVVTADTADMALFLMLALARRGVEGDMFVRVGRWQCGAMPLGVCMAGKIIGIVGLGKIGSAIARRAQAFDMDVVYHGRYKKDSAPYKYYDDIVSMAIDCDFLVMACAGGKGTHNIVDYKVLNALGGKGFLVNISRGSVVNEEDLLVALKNKSIGGAGLDVFADEPNVSQEVIKMDNVVLSPHVGGGTIETRSKMGQLVIQNFEAYFEGRPLLTPVKMVG